MRQRAAVVLIVFIFTVASGWLYAAGPASPARQQGSDPLGQRPGEAPKTDPDIEKKLAKERAKERFRDLKRDSERLLVMATELKQQVDKSGENVLSMDVVKKCEEIEKLAKSVRTKMRGD
jgi:hypothetical protein